MKKTLFIKLTLVLICDFFATPVNSQIAKLGAVHARPNKFNNFLVLEKDYPNAKQWEVSILSRTFDTLENIQRYKVEQVTKMGKSYYFEVDEKYKNSEKYFIEVTAYDENNDILVQEGPFPICTDCQIGFSCRWGCVGKNYAYSLNLNPVSSGSSLLQISDLVPSSGNYLYYYEWIKEQNWSNYLSNQSYFKAFYGLNSLDPGAPGNAGKLIVVTDVDTQDHFLDISNSLCLGTVYGIRKYLGPWYPSQGNMKSNIIIGGEELCGQTFTWAKNAINANSSNFVNNIQQLSCNGDAFTPTQPTTPESVSNASEIAPNIENCIEIYITVVNSDNNFVDAIQYFGDCDKNTSGMAFVWPETIKNISLTSMSDTTYQNFSLNKNTFFDDNGNYIFPGINFSPGLYYLGLQLSKGIYIGTFFERKDSTFQNLTHSDFLNYTTYPNPLVKNTYKIDFQATANLEFNYIVKDILGNIVFSKNYKLSKNESLKDKINLDLSSNYTGMLFNTIKFSDGSILQSTMLKQ